MQQGKLQALRKACREALDVKLRCGTTLWLKKDLVALLVCKPNDLVLDRGTVPIRVQGKGLGHRVRV